MEGLSEEGVKGMLSGDYKTARHLETVKKRETDLPGGSVALEPVVYFHASLHSDAEGSPTMGTEVWPRMCKFSLLTPFSQVPSVA